MQETLNQLLIEWHHWGRGWQLQNSHRCSAMFQAVKSSRQWDDGLDIAERTLHDSTMKLLDFQVMELAPNYRTALQLQARNLATGRNVWSSPRLPTDLASRAQLLGLARQALSAKLVLAGIL